MDKHTPGPWFARLTKYYGKTDDQQDLTVGTDHESICILTASRGHTTEAMPDARLIAAAPDLLEALQALHALLDFDEMIEANDPITFDDPSGINEAMRNAREAIKYAKGAD
jgi:hypothetical protein